MAGVIARITTISIMAVTTLGLVGPSRGQENPEKAYEACKRSCMGRNLDIDSSKRRKCESLCANFKKAAEMYRQCMADEFCRTHYKQ